MKDYTKEIINMVWRQAPYCNCQSNDCHPNHHRLCNKCYTTIIYEYYNTNNSRFSWTIEQLGNKNDINELNAVHYYCKNKTN